MTGYRNLGDGVTQSPTSLTTGGHFGADERSYESVVILDDKPVIDWEMNLRNQISSLNSQLSNQGKYPTCWLNGDFLESPSPGISGSYVFLPPVPGNENKFILKASNINANGWPIRFEFSGTSTVNENLIVLGNPPTSGSRSDLIILEFWRALVSAQPSVKNKSNTALIFRNGNVKAPDSVNLADDLIDPVYNEESTKRVQIQYRYRVIENVDTSAYPNGIDSPTVFAHSVSDFTGSGSDGSVTVRNYNRYPNDGGLWVAGQGTFADSDMLGTVDGFMYATPICVVYRRNNSAFNRNTNLNGGSIVSAGFSTRPDGLYADQIAADDIRDLRLGYARDLHEVLQKSIQQVFDNTLSTNQETIGSTSGHTLFSKEDIGAGGDNGFGRPDGVRRYFSDRSITETIVFKVDIGGIPQSNAVFNLSNVLLPWSIISTNLLVNAPLNTSIVGVTSIRYIGTYLSVPGDYDAIKSGIIDSISYSTNIGPQIDQINIEFTSPLSSGYLYIETLVEYPCGFGASRNIKDFVSILGPDPSISSTWIDLALFTSTSDPTRFILDESLAYCNPGHREATIRLKTISVTSSIRTSNINEFRIPERLTGSITIDDGINAPYSTTNYSVNTAYTTVILTGINPVPAFATISITYTSHRPAPVLGTAPVESYQFYYRSAAHQSINPPAGVQTLNLIPRVIDQNAYIISSSTGSSDDSFPYYAPSEQIPVGVIPSINFVESNLNSPAQIGIVGFGVNTGFIRIPLMIPYSPNPSQVTLYKDGTDQTQDGDGRGFWSRSQDPNSSSINYSPVVFGVTLSNAVDHKVVVPVLMELKEDFLSIGRKGQLVLVVFTNYLTFSEENKIEFRSSISNSIAAVYRVNGNLLNVRSCNA